MTDVERLLRTALVPIEPPGRLDARLEDTLAGLADAAADELADWELSAMRDPRNWVRPVAAVAVGSAAAGALVLVRARRHARQPSPQGLGGLRGLDRGARAVVRGARRRLKR